MTLPKDNVPILVYLNIYDKFTNEYMRLTKKTSVHQSLGADDTMRVVKNTYPNFCYFTWKGQTIRNPNWNKK